MFDRKRRTGWRGLLITACIASIALAAPLAGCGSTGTPASPSGVPAAQQEPAGETTEATETVEEEETTSTSEPQPDEYQRASEEAERQHQEAIENSNRIAQETQQNIEANKVE